MNTVFLQVLKQSLSAGWLILAIIPVRFFLKKAPKRIHCLLWALVAVRLLCPFSPEAAFSLVPAGISRGAAIDEWTKQYAEAPLRVYEDDPLYEDRRQSGLQPMSGEDGRSYILTGNDGLTPPDTVEESIVPLLSRIWALGAVALLLYALIRFILLKARLGASLPAGEGVLACDEVPSPFILGVFRPVIYVPASMKEETLTYVIAHEKAHIAWHDHQTKPFGYLLLALHWFNPLCWLAYCLFCRDLEAACDEKVIRKLDPAAKAAYSQALLSCSLPRSRIAVSPLAFGELDVKKRVTSILRYKKPALWLTLAAAAGCLILALCFMTGRGKSGSDVPIAESSAANTESSAANTESSAEETEIASAEPEGETPGLLVLREEGDLDKEYRYFCRISSREEPVAEQSVWYSREELAKRCTETPSISLSDRHRSARYHSINFDGGPATSGIKDEREALAVAVCAALDCSLLTEKEVSEIVFYISGMASSAVDVLGTGKEEAPQLLGCTITGFNQKKLKELFESKDPNATLSNCFAAILDCAGLCSLSVPTYP